MGTFIDLTGNKYGEWTVIERDLSCKNKKTRWICECSCGTIRSVDGLTLRNGSSVSCGCKKNKLTSKRTSEMVEDLTGKRFGEWEVLRLDRTTTRNSKRGARWICRCSCGTEKSVLGYSLRLGRTLSCGHRKSELQIEDLSGKTFGFLDVIEFGGYHELPSGKKITQWKCFCNNCKNDCIIYSKDLKSGKTDCGCGKNHEYAQIGIGDRFGLWTVVDDDPNDTHRHICRCECGNTRSVNDYALFNGRSKSCGCGRSKKRNLVGERFGNLIVIDQDETKHGKGVYWRCSCSCGNICSYRTNMLVNGYIKSCGCLSRELSSQRAFIDMTGQRFGRLLVQSVEFKKEDDSGCNHYFWRCICDCGNETVVIGDSLRGGQTTSCGCLRAEKSASRSKEKMDDLRGKRFGKLMVTDRVEVSKNDGTNVGLWKCKCDCGNESLVQGYRLIHGFTSSCGCLKQSRLEIYVLQFFDEIGYLNLVDYECQKKFEGLTGYGDGLLSYDFAVYKDGKVEYLIECQGQQHFFPVGIFGGEEQFAKQQLHDEEKKKYAQSINVPLIEVPYTCESYEDAKRILIDSGIS